MSGSPTIVVWERTGAWAAAIRREQMLSAGHLLETRTWEDCEACFTEQQAAWLVLELRPDNAAIVVATLFMLQRRFPQVRPVVVADSRLASLELQLRDCGALAFVTSARRIGELGLSRLS